MWTVSRFDKSDPVRNGRESNPQRPWVQTFRWRELGVRAWNGLDPHCSRRTGMAVKLQILSTYQLCVYLAWHVSHMEFAVLWPRLTSRKHALSQRLLLKITNSRALFIARLHFIERPEGGGGGGGGKGGKGVLIYNIIMIIMIFKQVCFAHRSDFQGGPTHNMFGRGCAARS